MKISRGPFLGILFFLLSVQAARAGFGITPPYVKNDALARDSVYSQRIVISRSDPVEDLKADVTVNVPGANEWIVVDRGLSFILPKGQAQVPIEVSVQVPKKAKFGQYLGNMRIVISPSGPPVPGTVGITLGAQVDVDLKVVDKKITDFRIRGTTLQDLEEGHKFLGLFFPGKIRFGMLVQNLGNVPFGPTRVEFKIYDNAGEKLLESTENTNRMAKVKPYDIQNVTAELPTRLPPGSYKARFTIFKNNDVAQQGELNLSILPYGTLPGYHGYYFFGLTALEQLIVVASVLGVLALLVAIIWLTVRAIRRRRT